MHRISVIDASNKMRKRVRPLSLQGLLEQGDVPGGTILCLTPLLYLAFSIVSMTNRAITRFPCYNRGEIIYKGDDMHA